MNNEINWDDSVSTNDIPNFNWEEPVESTESTNDIPNFNWEEPTKDPSENPQNNNPQSESIEDSVVTNEFNTEDSIIEIEDLNNSQLERNFNYLGNIPSLTVNTKLWKVNTDNDEILSKDINLNELTSIDNECKFQLNLQPETSLSNLLLSISKTGLKHGLKLSSAFLYRVKPNESTLNIFKGNPRSHFIYFLQADYNSGEVLLDLSAINGPTTKILDSTPGLLVIFDGWVPYRISKNQNQKDLIAVAGTFV